MEPNLSSTVSLHSISLKREAFRLTFIIFCPPVITMSGLLVCLPICPPNTLVQGTPSPQMDVKFGMVIHKSQGMVCDHFFVTLGPFLWCHAEPQILRFTK